ncbi:interleukin-11 [Astyanax mexicanus]|uniref:interleukin-11 n=1 Tax=Astyanax mexicanus TaxID=7994 RepID=UPI0020CB313A|nr:interleukin-11 [Astyanax mexicanus]
MKLTVLPRSTSFLLFLLLLVELPLLSMSRPAPTHKDGLTRLLQQMHRLLTLVQGVLSNLDTHLPFEHKLHSLPIIHFRPQDLATVEMNTTLTQLSSGLHSFKLHFDWLLHWEDQAGLETHKSKEIDHQIQNINNLLHKQMPELPLPNTTLNLPPPSSAWDMFQTSAVVHRRLLLFCDWYLRALRVLKLQAKQTQRQ